jgi:signal transduction histidine kinase
VIAREVQRLQRQRLAVLLIGSGLEIAVIALLAADGEVGRVRGVSGESAVMIAVLAALAGGPVVGASVALIGWIFFFPLIAHSAPASIAALPLWTATAFLVGGVASRLVRSERERAQLAVDDMTAHRLRTPVATIYGMAQTLRRRDLDLDDANRDRLLALIEHESGRLLASSLVDPVEDDGAA